jgi:hypothetical protein
MIGPSALHKLANGKMLELRLSVARALDAVLGGHFHGSITLGTAAPEHVLSQQAFKELAKVLTQNPRAPEWSVSALRAFAQPHAWVRAMCDPVNVAYDEPDQQLFSAYIFRAFAVALRGGFNVGQEGFPPTLNSERIQALLQVFFSGVDNLEYLEALLHRSGGSKDPSTPKNPKKRQPPAT